MGRLISRLIRASAAWFIAAGLITPSLGALTVKLGSPFPEGTPWDTSLKRMAARWRDISDGDVRLRVYPGGVAGDEGDMVRKMRFGQLDAAVLTAFGMKTIVPDSFVMAMPGILRTEAELDYVLREFTPRFDGDFVDAGFRVLVWSKSGWAYFFSERAARTPDAMREERLSVGNTDKELASNFKAMRFNVVPMSINEVMVGLQSGMISALYAPPMAAAAYQWFSQASYMLDFQLAPVLGGIVISERTWQRIPQRFHRPFREAMREAAGDFFTESERINADALVLMKENGLDVLELSEEETDEWFRVMSGGHSLVVGEGKWIDEAVYADLVSMLGELR